jgi:hypothetical protein
MKGLQPYTMWLGTNILEESAAFIISVVNYCYTFTMMVDAAESLKTLVPSTNLQVNMTEDYYLDFSLPIKLVKFFKGLYAIT